MKDKIPEKRSPKLSRKTLQHKYRQLRLLQACDQLTDKHTSFKPLIKNTLSLLRRFFRCEHAAFMRFDNDLFTDDDFLCSSGEEGLLEPLKKLLQDLLKNFIQEPREFLLENSPRPSLANLGLRQFLIVPMILNAELEGAFLLANKKVPFTELDRELLGSASSQIDNAIVYARNIKKQGKTERELQRRKRELDILYNMSISLSLGYDFESLSRKVIESAMGLFKIDRASVMILDPEKNELKTVVIAGESKNIQLVKLAKGKGIAGQVLLTGKPIIANAGSEDERFVPYDFASFQPKRIYALASVPLISEGKPLGVLNFSHLTPVRSFKEKHLETLMAAAHMISLGYQRQQYYHLSIKDELTGLYSFRYFQGRLREEAIKATRYNFQFSLILFDLDHFKNVNDTWGHQFGNVALRKVADVLTASIRIGADMPARYGGEEMALILPHTDLAGGRLLAERIRTQVEALHLESNGQLVPITISGGLAQFPLHSTQADQLLKMADEALYKAKESGRNRITTIDSL